MKYQKYELVLKKAGVRESKHEYRIDRASDVAGFCLKVLKMDSFPEERFISIMLDTKGEIIGYQEVSKGDLNTAPVHPREVFKAAILSNAASIICVHNHPSGDPTPSEPDKLLTGRLVKCGHLLGIRLLDHVVVGDDCYVSMLGENMIFMPREDEYEAE